MTHLDSSHIQRRSVILKVSFVSHPKSHLVSHLALILCTRFTVMVSAYHLVSLLVSFMSHLMPHSLSHLMSHSVYQN